ncbi:MAG: 50S ribosomal protein L4 [Intestinibaculum porci]|uniref:50S ribosomal protein L4 n=1 Tax=Intestinibaculum porci TaxID=2487118 RepID=UPI003F0A0F54
MAKVALLNQKAENVGEIELNDAVFGIEPNNQAIFDMVLLQRASLRQGTHKVKGRSEVRGGGKKPWRQKGTGRARQGSTRAPQWVGGGTVFGPTPRSYKFKLNKKVRRLALRSALSQKLIDNEFTALDALAFDTKKTKNMVEVMNAFETPRKALIVVDEINENVALSARNLPNVKLLDAKHLNVYDVLNSTNLFMTEAAIKAVEEVLA